jgi:hypothetical protein
VYGPRRANDARDRVEQRWTVSYRNAPLTTSLAPPDGFFRRLWGRLTGWLILRRVRQTHRNVYAWGGLRALRVYKEACARNDGDAIYLIEWAVALWAPQEVIDDIYEKYRDDGQDMFDQMFKSKTGCRVVLLPEPGRLAKWKRLS